MPYNELSAEAATAVVVGPVTLGGPLTSVGETLLTMRTELALRLGGREDIAAGRIDRWINAAYLEIADSLKLPALDASFVFSIDGDDVVLLPAILQEVKHVSIVEGLTPSPGADKQLEFMSVDSYRKAPAEEGWPSYYTFQQRVMAFYASPTGLGTLTVDAVVLPNKLEADTDSSILGMSWDEALMTLALSKCHTGLQEYDEGAQLYNVYLSMVRSKIDRKAEQRGAEIAAFRPARSRRTFRNSAPRREEY